MSEKRSGISIRINSRSTQGELAPICGVVNIRLEFRDELNIRRHSPRAVAFVFCHDDGVELVDGRLRFGYRPIRAADRAKRTIDDKSHDGHDDEEFDESEARVKNSSAECRVQSGGEEGMEISSARATG